MNTPGQEREMECPEYFGRGVHRRSPVKSVITMKNILIVIGLALCICMIAKICVPDKVAPDNYKVAQ